MSAREPSSRKGECSDWADCEGGDLLAFNAVGLEWYAFVSLCVGVQALVKPLENRCSVPHLEVHLLAKHAEVSTEVNQGGPLVVHTYSDAVSGF